MPNNKIPRNLNDWQLHLQRLVLPIDPGIKNAVLQKLPSRTANASNIAAMIKQDPALSLQLMTEANKSLPENETSSLSHTLSLLGFPQVEHIIRRTPSYDSHRFPQLRQYRQQLSISLHAAYQAQAWASFNPHWQQQQLFWPTLFHRAPIWALWYRAGELMQQLDGLRGKHQGANHSSHEQQLLGCKVHTLATTMSRRWQLPKLSQQGWQSQQSGKERQWILLSRIMPEQSHLAMEQLPRLQQLRNQPAFIIALANKLADETEWDWFSERTLRLQNIVATALQQSRSSSIALTHQQSAVCSRASLALRCLSPASQLLSFYRKADAIPPPLQPRPPASHLSTTNKPTRPAVDKKQAETIRPVAARERDTNNKQPVRKPPASATKPQQSVTPASSRSSAAVMTSEYDSVLERILQQPESFESIDTLIQLALATLCHQLGFERSSASLLHQASKELRPFLTCNADDSPALKNFHHPLKPGDLFSKLLQKPLSLRLQASNYSQLWPLLPGNFKQACGADEFFMMSVFAGSKPIAIIYADHGNSNTPLTEQQYQQFKQLCRSLSVCLPSLA